MRRAFAVLLLLGVACSGPAIRVRPPRAHPRQQAHAGRRDQAPVDVGALAESLGRPAAKFDRSDLVGPVQRGSTKLAGVVPLRSHLQIAALHSQNGSAAVEVVEDDFGHDRWGHLMIPAERDIIRAFAADHALGRSLIIVDDVRVHGGADPVPMTGYRWSRSDVEAYARCGIPPRAIDACTSAFYQTPAMWLLPTGNKTQGA
jgi:hypothetical protein